MVSLKLSPPDWKEARRLRAYELKQDGWTQREIADILNVSEAAVSQWLHCVAHHGVTGLCARPHTGSPPKLSAAQLSQLPDLLSHGPEAYGFEGAVWTCARVGTVIQREFEVRYHRAHVSRLLQALDWTPQRPIQYARQRDELWIAGWRSKGWSELRRRARLDRLTLVFVDESSFYLLPGVVRTYAPRGETPLLRVFQTHAHLSVMGALTLNGQWALLLQPQTLDSFSCVMFLRYLLHHLGRRLLIIWDRSPIHRAEEVQEFLDERVAQQMYVTLLPPYAPDLNPTEGVWQQLKHVELRNQCCATLQQLAGQLTRASRRIATHPRLLQSFFAGAGLSLESA